MEMPKDSAILLSIINMKLRDFYNNLDELCGDMEWSRAEVEERLGAISYAYDSKRNQFV